jgi:hypothetical protein
MVVPGANGGEILAEVLRNADFAEPAEQSLLDCAEEPLDPSVLPGAERRGALVADAEQPETEAEEPRGEGRLVVGAKSLWPSEGLECIEKKSQHTDRRAVAKLAQREAATRDRRDRRLSEARSDRAGKSGRAPRSGCGVASWASGA